MKKFPENLTPQNRKKFSSRRFNRELCKLRAQIVDYMYSESKSGLDLGRCVGEKLDIVNTACEELHQNGWKTILCYGNTTLFIYDNIDELPETARLDMNNIVLDEVDDVDE